jgi:hypothetical protein
MARLLMNWEGFERGLSPPNRNTIQNIGFEGLRKNINISVRVTGVSAEIEPITSGIRNYVVTTALTLQVIGKINVVSSEDLTLKNVVYIMTIVLYMVNI